MKRIAVILTAVMLVMLTPQPAPAAGRLALYIHMHNWSAKPAWLTFYSCGWLGCDILWAKEIGTNRQGSGQYTLVTATVSNGEKFKLRVEVRRPDGGLTDRAIEANATHQNFSACVHSDYTFTWC